MDKKKKLILIGAIIVIVVIAIIIIAIIVNSSSNDLKKEDSNSASVAKSAVIDYINAINSQDASKVLKKIDYKGFYVFKKLVNEETNEFINAYKEYDGSEASEYESNLEKYFDNIFESLSDYEEYSYEFEVSEITDTEKLDTGFYKIIATINSVIYEDGEKDESSSNCVFYTYKGKVVYDDSILSSAYSYMMWYY